MPSAGGLIVRTNVPFWLAPVTMRVERLADRDRCSSSAAAVLRTDALDLVLGVFALGAVLGDGGQLVVRVRRRRVGERRLDEPLRHEVGVAAVRRGRVRVVVRRQTEVAAGILARQVERVDAGSHQLDDRERQIRKALRIGRAPVDEKVRERERVRRVGQLAP